MSKHYKIVRLSGENFKRMKAFEISPDGTMQVISGKNAQGKSSILDSIWAACQWKAATKETPMPINKDGGDQRGYIEMEIGDAESMEVADYIITRTFREKEDGKITTSLKITDSRGDTKRSPQALIDGLVGDLSFDPLEFAEMKEDKQCDRIAQIVQTLTGTDITQFDVKHKQAFDERRDLKRDRKGLASVLETATPPTDSDPTEEISAVELMAELREAEKSNKAHDQAKDAVLQASEKVNRLKKELEGAEAALKAAEEVLDAAPEPIDTSSLEEKISQVDELNRQARNTQRYNSTKKSLEELDSKIDRCNAIMELSKIEKREAIEAAKLPVDGLEVTEAGVILNSVPFIQASMAEKLKVSMAIAMCANPSLRVIRIRDASLLDTDNFAVIRKMAEEYDYQLWVELVDESGELGVYIEEGEVAN